MKYKIIDDLTSDVMFEAYGKGLKELFENAAEAMFSIICKVDKVEKKKPIKVKVDADGVEDLMIKWLQELIAVVDTEEMFLSKFNIKNIDEASKCNLLWDEGNGITYCKKCHIDLDPMICNKKCNIKI